MCGIAGAISSTGESLNHIVLGATSAQQHRGPDDEGLWSDGVCALGHRRLSIIDLSEAGRQPMSNENGDIWITFNGEIYNFESLRSELESLGHRFRTRTDTEVIIRAYEAWGEDAVKRLRGMFAFAIWDQRCQRLMIARDRAGKKPLFYTRVGNSFFFASEIQGLLAIDSVPRAINFAAIDSYLSWGYVPAPQTAFEGIYKLMPAHYLTVNIAAETLKENIECYWSLDYEQKLDVSEREAAEALREKLTESVRLRMISDVPLGAFLSGGIDSSIVVGLMANLSSTPVKTFSIGFEEADYNELDHARRVSQLWGTDHHEFIVKPDALSILPKLVRHFGEPFADSSAIPTFYISEMTRRSVTVALTGDGGDESFAGYERYFANRVADRLQKIPGFGLAARAALSVLPASKDHKNQWQRFRRFFSAAASPRAHRYGAWVSGSTGHFSEHEKSQIYSGDFRSLLNRERPVRWMESLFDNANNLDAVDASMSVDVRSYLPYDLLTKVDITSMAVSLEARSPLLDHEVMELAARLPVSYKLKGRASKYLLKTAFADMLPQENIERGKMGFGVPVGKWFRGPLRQLLRERVLSGDSLLSDCFDASALNRLVDEHLDGRVDHGFQLWNLLMLELWHDEVVRRSPVSRLSKMTVPEFAGSAMG
jgi:asparagine synthase (glutamine-hydrolysing)